LFVEEVFVAEEAFGFVRVVSEDGGRGGRGVENLHSASHCSLHHLEYRNVDGCTLGWCCGHFSYRLRVRYIAQHVFVSGQKVDVYDVPIYGDLYSMGVLKNVCRVFDHYDDV
jgi:hypothetical protein